MCYSQIVETDSERLVTPDFVTSKFQGRDLNPGLSDLESWVCPTGHSGLLGSKAQGPPGANSSCPCNPAVASLRSSQNP